MTPNDRFKNVLSIEFEGDEADARRALAELGLEHEPMFAPPRAITKVWLTATPTNISIVRAAQHVAKHGTRGAILNWIAPRIGIGSEVDDSGEKKPTS